MSEMVDLEALAVQFVQAYHPLGNDPLALVGVLRGCPLRNLKDGEALFREGDPPSAMFFLLEGRLRVFREDAHGVAQRITSIHAPSIIGHMSLVDDSAHSATSAARGPALVATLPAEAFQELLKSSGPRGTAMRHLLLAAMSDQLAGANGRIRALIDPATVADLDDDTTGNGINQASRALEGWLGPGSEEDTNG